MRHGRIGTVQLGKPMKDMRGLTFRSCHQELLLEDYDGEKKGGSSILGSRD